MHLSDTPRAKANGAFVDIKRFMLASVSGSALLLSSVSFAAAQEAAPEQIVVSASRITAAGFDAPTPTTVLSADALIKSAQPNIFDSITQLPSLQGSTGSTVGNNGTSGGTNGLSSLNLRGIGANRTLVLLDNQRVVPANVTGITDISQFPQLLIERVDVVTGGASASFGSDAVAGVVNFVTQKNFVGLKGNVQAGISTYGDDFNTTAQFAAGTTFLGGRGHVEASVEYLYSQGVPPGGPGNGPGPNGRTWYVAPNIQQRTIANTPAGSPQYTYATDTQDYLLSKYGLITAGPLQGTAFGTGGAPYTFVYGSSGVPSKAANGAVSNCVSPFCVGGDTTGNPGNGTTLVAPLTRGDLYVRASYDLTPTIEIYGTLNMAEVYGQNYPQVGARKEAVLTIQCGNAAGGPNAFLPAIINTACVSNNITSFQYGVSNDILPTSESVKDLRNQRRYVIGADGTFSLFGKDWLFDTYFQHGENDTNIHIEYITLTPRYNAAIDAIASGGQIVCRSAAARSSGCVPLNIIGNNVPTESSLNYIEPLAGPYQHTTERQEAFSAVVNGTPFQNWAGDVAVAFGVEYREEAYNVVGDPYSNGVSASSPLTSDYPADPLLDLVAGNNWYAGNFHSGGGKYHVKEAFLETGVPLFNSDSFGKMDLDLAGRATDYSTSGYVNTWKVGLTWQTPLDGVKFRGVQSRDVRAPNLSELFTAANVGRTSVINPATGASTQVQSSTIGNTALKPEKSQTTEVGIVFQPSWFPGFSASIDYFRVAIKGQISSIANQTAVNLCYASNFTSPVCSAINLTSAAPFVNAQVFNLASVVTDGADLEASYQFDLQQWDIPGDFVMRALVTHTSKFITDPGVPGGTTTEIAGNNTGTIPLWKSLTTQSWQNERFGFTLTERWFSDGVFNKNYITCTTGCPLPTAQSPTINFNTMPGAFYLDVGGSFNATEAMQFYFKINNIANLAPQASPGTASNNFGLNPSLYDTIGRMFRVGVRLSDQ